MSCCDTKHPMISKGGFTACAPGSLPGGLVRTRFFDGMILTQADLENEQRYWRVKRRLTNRALGTGVVWGLRLRWDAKRRVFLLGPGYALDCCGNDLIVECPVEVAEATLLDTADPEISAGADTRVVRAAQNPLRHACVVLQYVECPEDARPVHLDPCAPPSSRCEASRIRETTRLLLVPPPSAPPADCFDELIADLEELKNSLTEPLKSQLFPPTPATPPSGPGFDTQLPATLTVTTPGSGAHTAETIQPPVNGGSAAVSVSGTRTPDGLRAGLVQFELRPWAEWGFYQGEVRDGSAVVDRVAAPVDLHQFWSLEITLPQNTPNIADSFEYRVDALGLEEMFGAHRHGIAELIIRGRVSVSGVDGGGVTTKVDGLTVEVRSEVGAGARAASCFDTLFPWGLMAEPETGERDAKVLLLAAAYAYFTDVTARSGGAWTPQRLIAALIYVVMWRLLGVDLTIPNAEEQKQELARILARLFECWCDAMLYPGPRCIDEHHGVYLGCASIAPGGRILAFDMWEHRRHVVLGPLIEHWLGVFGLAPIDVVAARIAQAICCLAGLPPPTLPDLGNKEPGIAIGRGRLTVGPVRAGAGVTGPARDVGVPEMIRRLVAGFVADNGAPLERVRTRTREGSVIELIAPALASAASSRGTIDPHIDDVLRRGEALPPLARTAARAAIAELAREVDLTALPELPAPAAELAKRLSAAGRTLADVVELGAEGVLGAFPEADPAAVDALVTRAEAGLAGLAEGVGAAARKPAPARASAVLRDTELRKAIAADVKKRFGLTRPRVDAALDRAASRS